MDIKTIPTADLKVVKLRIPTGTFDMQTGISLLVEMYNKQGLIVDKHYLEIPTLPKVVHEGQEIQVVDYIKNLALQSIKLEENTASDEPD